jgi:hypothetical protein
MGVRRLVVVVAALLLLAFPASAQLVKKRKEVGQRCSRAGTPHGHAAPAGFHWVHAELQPLEAGCQHGDVREGATHPPPPSH